MNNFSRQDTKIAKFVAVAFMIMYHMFAFPEQYEEGIPYLPLFSSFNLEYIIGEFGNICISVFVCLSGYGTFLAMENTENISKLVQRKIFVLYKKYWLVFFIIVPLLIFMKPNEFSINPSQIIINMIGLKSDYNMHWWFIAPFAVLTILSPHLVAFVKKRRSSAFMDFLLIVLVETIIRYIMPALYENDFMNTFCESMFGRVMLHTISFISTYLVGASIAKYGLFDKYLSLFNRWYTAIPISLVIMFLVFWMRTDRGLIWDYIYAPLFIISSVTIIKNLPGINVIAAKAGEVSTEMWLIHGPIYQIFIPQIIFLPRVSFLAVVWLMVICYILGKLLVFVLNKFENRLKKSISFSK